MAIVEAACDRLEKWRTSHVWWTRIHYGLSVVALILTLSSASLPSMIGTHHVVLYPSLALTAAVLVAFIAFATPAKQARSYIAAWRLLDSRIFRYAEDPTPERLSDLLSGIEDGERILAGKDPY